MIRTFYSTNPRCARTRLYLDDKGNRDAISIHSRTDDVEAETLFLYKGGKRKLARRIEERKATTTEFLYPVYTGKPMRIREIYHPKGKVVSTTTYDEHWREIDFQWADAD